MLRIDRKEPAFFVPTQVVRIAIRAAPECAARIARAVADDRGIRLVDAADADVLITDTPGVDSRGVLLVAPRAQSRPDASHIQPDADARQLVAAIHAVAAGLVVTPVRTAVESPDHLTAREIEILHLLADGDGNKRIAARLGISANTVKFHISTILDKLGAASRTEAVTAAIRRGLLWV